MEAQRTLQGKSMFGDQTLSNRRSAPSHGFGSSTRGHANKVFMGSEHAKTSSLSCTPGPCYEMGSSCGSQGDSGKVSPPQWRFGTVDRDMASKVRLQSRPFFRARGGRRFATILCMGHAPLT